MSYTVKKLSELSGVTIRALHFYEEMGLLCPAYYGSNGYRYYEEKELLKLQQILFFKELGFSLKQIQKVMGQSDFDILKALYSHKKALSQQWEKIGFLLRTLDKTIKHLKGQKKMSDIEIFDGFNITLITKAKGEESYFTAEEIVGRSVKKPTQNLKDVQKNGRAYYENVAQETRGLFQDLARCIEKGLDPTSAEVQSLIQKHHRFAEQFHNATKEVYKALAELYQDHPEFRKQLDPFHPQLAEFIALAMKVFADRNLA